MKQKQNNDSINDETKIPQIVRHQYEPNEQNDQG